MTSAKRTPRYVDAIRSFDVMEGGATEVIRLRPEPMGPALPPITAAWPRAKAVPVMHRPWQLLLVPPTPGAPTRSFIVARWQARLVMAAACVVLVVAGAGVVAFVVAIRSPDLFTTSSESALLRSRLTIVEDSLALARAELESPDDSLAAGAAVASAGPLAASAGAAPATRAPLRAREAASDAAVASSRGAFEGLPVIGAIASRFSLARRHPLLHITRPHLGVDVAAPRGTRISAPAPGRISFVGRKFGFGLVVEIAHAGGVTTRYAHCGRALVAEGARVTRGTAIATVGTSGLSTGPHLHYEVLVHGHQVDPLRFRMPQRADSTAATPAAPAAATPSATPAATAGSVVTPG